MGPLNYQCPFYRVQFKPKAVTELLGIGKNTFYALANAGQLPAVRIGKQWRVRREDLERYFTATAGSFSD